MKIWNKEKEKSSFQPKFEALWIGLYHIEKVIFLNSYFLKDMKETVQALLVNGQYLKHLFC